jgi:hypothetical protein
MKFNEQNWQCALIHPVGTMIHSVPIYLIHPKIDGVRASWINQDE